MCLAVCEMHATAPAPGVKEVRKRCPQLLLICVDGWAHTTREALQMCTFSQAQVNLFARDAVNEARALLLRSLSEALDNVGPGDHEEREVDIEAHARKKSLEEPPKAVFAMHCAQHLPHR